MNYLKIIVCLVLVFLFSCKEDKSKQIVNFDFTINGVSLDGEPKDYVGEPDINNKKEVLIVTKETPSISGKEADGSVLIEIVENAVSQSFTLKVNGTNKQETSSEKFDLRGTEWKIGLNKITVCNTSYCLSKYIDYQVMSVLKGTSFDGDHKADSNTKEVDHNEEKDDDNNEGKQDGIQESLDSDKDGVPDKLDKCPTQYGPQSNNGCPEKKKDSDGDGIPDISDNCPNENGPESNNGCPVKKKDSDGDGLSDDTDECPSVAGPRSNNGCPVKKKDSDGDGIYDESDRCPDKKGPRSNNGCPVKRPVDSDGDGVNDDIDKCPQEHGPSSNSGCPLKPPPILDSDKDGIPDNVDKCKNQKGTKAYHGCPPPDKDGDGIPDDKDKCPGKKGSARNKGCPEVKFVSGKSIITAKDETCSSSYTSGPYSVTLKPASDLELEYISVYSKSGKVTVSLSGGSSGDDVQSGIQINSGRSEISLTGLSNRKLKAGSTYVLKIEGAELVDYAECPKSTKDSNLLLEFNGPIFFNKLKY